MFFRVETGQDLTPKVNELREKLEKAREKIEMLPGISFSKEEQERQIEILREQLSNKTQLLIKYKTKETFT